MGTSKQLIHTRGRKYQDNLLTCGDLNAGNPCGDVPVLNYCEAPG